MSHVIRACVVLFLVVRDGVEVGGCDGEGGAGEAVGEFWEVRTRGGAVRGRRAPGGYYSFFGIPYGAPPTGDHRFKPPRPAAPWAGVLESDTRRLCPQPPTYYSATPLGEEDCLTLDVFAPSPAHATPVAPRAVLVFLHGGGFLFDTRPVTTEAVRYVLQHDIIVVTINYRLGVLGFLCLGTEEAPGNAGLRDVIMALRWVRDNIVAFGGDPARVGLAGHSAGAFTAHLLALTPAAAGLFHVAFCSDGTALTDKVLMTYPVTTARRYAKKLGFESEDVSNLTAFYKSVSVEKILNQSLNFYNLDNGELGFSPCVERPVPGVEPIIARAPVLSLARNSRPIMFTFCDDEGSTRAADLIKSNRKYNTDFPAFMPANLDFPNNEVKYAVANKTRAFYFGNKTITEDLAVEFSNFWGDRQFVYQAVFCASEHARLGAQSHLLEFTYVGGLAENKSLPAAPGAAHTDFFNYLMPPKKVVDQSDLRVVEEITSIVAHFVKTGRARASAPWPAAEPTLTRVAALHIGNDRTEPLVGPLPERLAFWDRLYRRYRREDYWPVLADDDN